MKKKKKKKKNGRRSVVPQVMQDGSSWLGQEASQGRDLHPHCHQFQLRNCIWCVSTARGKQLNWWCAGAAARTIGGTSVSWSSSKARTPIRRKCSGPTPRMRGSCTSSQRSPEGEGGGGGRGREGRGTVAQSQTIQSFVSKQKLNF